MSKLENQFNRQCRLAEPFGLMGLGQLSLVEHALCPIDSRTSLRPGLRHASCYAYTDSQGARQRTRVEVFCPLGLSPQDDFYLWGLLALTLAQEQPSSDFYVTPHYCLKQLGMVTPGSKGGKNYRLFRESLARLSTVRYQNDRFWDPVRKEHRRTAFGFFSYSLPLDDDSSRGWRIVWDPLFYEYCTAGGSRLRFDLAVYRQLDPASRRLFLLLSKVFWRRKESPWFDLQELAVGVIGFSEKLPTWKLKEKVTRSLGSLHRAAVVRSSEPQEVFRRRSVGNWSVRVARGAHFDRPQHSSPILAESPLREPLVAIGLEEAAVGRVLRRYPHELVRVWSDVTLAALERRGAGFFKRSAAAFLIDNLNAAQRGERTPPDWFLAIRKEEQAQLAKAGREVRVPASVSSGNGLKKSRQPSRALEQLTLGAETVRELTAHFIAAGQPPETAKKNAHRLASLQQATPNSS